VSLWKAIIYTSPSAHGYDTLEALTLLEMLDKLWEYVRNPWHHNVSRILIYRVVSA